MACLEVLMVETKYTFCRICEVACGLKVLVENNKIKRIEPRTDSEIFSSPPSYKLKREKRRARTGRQRRRARRCSWLGRWAGKKGPKPTSHHQPCPHQQNDRDGQLAHDQSVANCLRGAGHHSLPTPQRLVHLLVGRLVRWG